MSTPSAHVDPRAAVDPQAVLGEGTTVGPFAVIGAKVVLGARVKVHPNAVIAGPVTIGDDCEIHPFASIGGPPQDLKYRGEDTRLTIGSKNIFRESCTVNRGTVGGGGHTTIGDGNLFMAGAHVAHDCHVGSGTIFANAATLAGHVTVEDHSTIGAYSGVHQFCKIGEHAFIGGYSVITQDAMPYVLTVGNRARAMGINVIGLKRKQFPENVVTALRRTYRTLFRSKMALKDAIDQVEAEMGSIREVAYFLEFVRSSERGVVR